MDPQQQDQTQGLNLPQPTIGDTTSPLYGDVSDNYSPQGTPVNNLTPPLASSLATGLPLYNEPVPVSQQISSTPQTSESQTVAPAYNSDTQIPVADIQDAEDTNGVIDQEWVDKASEVVERTHTDPYLESLELSKIKAQYIKARYNKDIKVVED
jgi:hypothetical protein